jgi:hypothetical protein
MKVILIVPDEGYSDRTRWRLFWSYLMKVILIVPDEGYSRNASWALSLVSMFLVEYLFNTFWFLFYWFLVVNATFSNISVIS